MIILHKKDHPNGWSSSSTQDYLLCALDITSLEALGAHICALDLTIELDSNLLDVRAEGTIRNAMRVADITTSAWCFTTDLTYFGHS
jgi:hypothetical protein